MYAERLRRQGDLQGDSFADGKAAMAIVGPWAIAVYKGKVELGRRSRCRPRTAWRPSEIYTFSDAKNVGLYTACKNQGTAWDVLKFATSEEQDGKLLETTGQMPLRTGPADGLPRLLRRPTRTTRCSRDQAARTVEVPNVPNSVEIWQTFRDAYSKAVIFGKADIDERVDRGRRQGQPTRRAVADRSGRPIDSRRRPRRPAGGRRPRVRAGAGRRSSAGSRWASLLAAPYAVFLAAIFAYPLVFAVWISLPRLLLRRARRGGRPARSSGCDNYTTVAHRPGRAAVVPATSAIFLVINVPLTVVLSLVLATALNRVDPRPDLPAGGLLRART